MKKPEIIYLTKPSDTSSPRNENIKPRIAPFDWLSVDPFSTLMPKKPPFRRQKENTLSTRKPICELMKFSPTMSQVKVPLEDTCDDFFEVNLSGRNMSSLPLSFTDKYSKLAALDLRGNKFSEISKEVLSLSELKTLKLDHNFIRYIPSEISKLTKLEVLSLSNNFIKELNPALTSLKELTALHLNENSELEKWPSWLNELQSLKILHLHNNRLMNKIPFSLESMNGLSELGFDWLGYILPNGRKVSKRQSDQRIISLIKELCRTLKSEVREHPYLEFKEFITQFKKTCRFHQKRTPLHMAAMWNHISIIKEIMMDDINEKDEYEFTPLILAIKYGKYEAANALLRSPRIRVSEYTGKYGTALHLLITKGYWELCKKVIQHHSFNPNTKDSKGNTPLHLLFATGDKDPVNALNFIKLLLNNPICNQNEVNNKDYTPAHYAAKKNQSCILDFILKANRKKRSYFNLSLTGGKYGYTILHLLAIHSDVEILNEYLKFGLDAAMVDNYGRTARNTITHFVKKRLLLHYERAARIKIVANDTTNINKPLNRYTEPTVNISQLKKRRRVPALETVEDRMSDIDEPSLIQLPQYTIEEPLMFEDMQKYKVGLKTERYCDDRLKVNSLALNFQVKIKEESDESNENDERKISNKPKVSINNPVKVKFIPNNKLLKNPFYSLYDSIISLSLPEKTQYKYIYYLHKEQDTHSEEILLNLCKSNINNSLKVDAVYLTGISSCIKLLNLLSRSKYIPVSVYYEILNAGGGVRQRKVAVKGRERMASIPAQITHGELKTQRVTLFSEAAFINKLGNYQTSRMRNIPSFTIRKTLNYFGN